jgi:Protein of unknown function (DUF2946)
MRRRLRKLLPIVLLALAVQILAPIAACWAAAIAASDPLSTVVICHDNGAASSGQTDPTGQPGAHAGCCSVCSVAQTGATIDAPQATIGSPYAQCVRVVWLDRIVDRLDLRDGFHAQARAPPLFS